MNIRPVLSSRTEKKNSLLFRRHNKILNGREILDANFIWMNNMKKYKVKSKSYFLRTFNASLILQISFFFSLVRNSEAKKKRFFLAFLKGLQVACMNDFQIKRHVAKYLRIS